MVEIRNAQPADAEQIAQVHVKSWQTTYQKIVDEEVLSAMNWEDRVESWRETIQSQGDEAIILVAVENERIVGFLSGGKARKPLEDCDAEIYAIYLLKESRGKGVGKQLMNRYFQWLTQNDFHSCFVWIAKENPYRSFYSSLGAEKTDYEGISRVRSNEIPTVAYIWKTLVSNP